jgi:two-component system sensor kinase FixL
MSGRTVGAAPKVRPRGARRRELEQRLLVDLALAVSECRDLKAATRLVLDRLCRETGWPYGEVWIPSDDGRRLELSPVWSGARREFETLHARSRAHRFHPGEGLPGRVWSARRPRWLKTLLRPRAFPRAAIARELGLRSGFGVPVLAGREVVAVLVFLDTAEWHENWVMSGLVTAVAALLGAPLLRRRSEDALRRANESLERLVLERTQALRESEAAHRAIVETAPDAIITIDERGRIESFNPAAERMFGLPSAKAVGENVSVLMPSPEREQHDAHLARYARTGERRVIGIGREVRAVRADGAGFPAHISVGEVRIGERRFYTGILRDLTELKRMQEEVVRTQRLAAIGEMSAAVAHEIKNPLAAMSGALQVLRDRAPEGESRRVMAEVLVQIARLDATVRKLGMLAKPWTPKKEACELADVADRVARAARTSPELTGVLVEVRPWGPAAASVDAGLVEQVLWNLILNAAQAMGRGIIRIDLHDRPRAVHVAVTDTGPGMAPEVRANLFKPFFTTKTAGSGLGLSICRSIMEAHGGRIDFRSEPGRGTTALLEFPKTS